MGKHRIRRARLGGAARHGPKPMPKPAPASLLPVDNSLADIRVLTHIASRDGWNVDQVPSMQP
ncbi:MAG: hypothetical protein EBY28_10580 [Betaproteobacteria bacterium]|nr:hypothetical protein [Betaproteobacteria bacterium]